jgi:ATP-dependent exoDNAse (exonuclease V) alpha subunit
MEATRVLRSSPNRDAGVHLPRSNTDHFLTNAWEVPRPLIKRNLLYTGVTRGKKLVVLVGQKKAVAIAVRNVSGRRRWSKLQEWLRPNPSLSRQIGVAS